MYMKIHRGQGKKIVAVCDRELIGKVLEDGDKFMDLNTYSSFYAGEPATKQRISEELGDFSSANIVGKKAVKTALELGLTEEKNVMYINDIPHIQIYRL